MLWLSGPAEAHPLLAALGPEPFDSACNAEYLWGASRRRKAAIKVALMDNHLVVGIGNIYANESLFRAGIRPTTPA
jgi:formamidopyrimidine-DNA glycosylase